VPRAGSEVVRNRGSNRPKLLLGDTREDRKGQSLFCKGFGDREGTPTVVEMLEGPGQMYGDRIVTTRKPASISGRAVRTT
jgi:hypothetical protein